MRAAMTCDIAFANNTSPDGRQRIWYAGQIDGRKAGNGLKEHELVHEVS